MIHGSGRKTTGDRITEVMEGDVAGEADILAVDIPAEAVVVTAGRAEKAIPSGKRCTNC